MNYEDELYDKWAIFDLEFKATYSWCQFCKNNIHHICLLTKKHVDDDDCCDDCEIDDDKLIAYDKEDYEEDKDEKN